MNLNRIVFLNFLIIFTSGNAKRKVNTINATKTAKPSSKVKRNFKARGLAHDFDITLVSQ